MEFDSNGDWLAPRTRIASCVAAAIVCGIVACDSKPTAPVELSASMPVAVPPSAATFQVYDDSVYLLPFPAGMKSAVGQGAFGVGGLGSHTNQYAIDFIMPERTPILAARGGEVVAVRDDCPNVNCPLNPDTCCGNYIRVKHADGSAAAYWHLVQHGSCVKVGDKVARGDVIGQSGNTGISLTPHLHFMVYAATAGAGTGSLGRSRDNTMEVAFEDALGDGVPVFLGVYTSQNKIGRDRCGG